MKKIVYGVLSVIILFIIVAVISSLGSHMVSGESIIVVIIQMILLISSLSLPFIVIGYLMHRALKNEQNNLVADQ